MNKTMIITTPPAKVTCSYIGAEKIKTINLKNQNQEEIQMSIYQTNFRAIDSKVYYQGVRIEMEQGRTFSDFEVAITEAVYQMLLELKLFQKTFHFIEENETESWDMLTAKCEVFVTENFYSGPVKHTYNNFYENMVAVCLYTAYLLLPNEEHGFSIFSDMYNSYDRIIKYDWELQEVGKEVILKIPRGNIVMNKKSKISMLFESMFKLKVQD